MNMIKPAKYLAAITLSLYSLIGFAGIDNGKAPDFTLPSNTDHNLKLEEQTGNVVLINFWASWCGPCREEMPYLNALHDEYADLGLTVWGVNVDARKKDADKAIKRLSVQFPVLFDGKNEIAELYKVDAMPTTVIVDRDGNIRHLHRGYQKGYEIDYQEQVNALLSE